MITLSIDNPIMKERATISHQVDAYRNGTSKLLTEEESNAIMNRFIENLKAKYAHSKK